MNRTLSPKQVLHKMCHYCAYRERSYKEVRDRLWGYALSDDQNEQIIAFLKENQYLDNQRFARAFVRGKFRIKKWGKIKIAQQLNAHKLDPACIKQGLAEIEETDYKATLTEIIKKKGEEVQQAGLSNGRSRVARYGIQKGYEEDLVWHTVDLLFCESGAL